MIWKSSTFFVSTVLFFTTLLASPAFGVQCNTHSAESILVQDLVSQVKLGNQLMYPANVPIPMQVKGNHLKFSFESEYLISETAGILKKYAPDESLGVSKATWNKMNDSERVAWMQQNLRNVFPEYRSTATSKLKLQERTDTNQFLPERLILDDTGNIEIVLSPMETFDNWAKAVNYINSEFGAGSMQGTIGIIKNSFLGLELGANTKLIQSSNIGYLRFVNELDTFEKLASGFKRYQLDPSKPVAQSFQHPFLGPMTAAKHESMLTVLDDLSGKNKLSFDEIKATVSENEASFKYFGGTAVRPDLDPKAIVLEIRDCHKNIICLFERMVRSTLFVSSTNGQFTQFSRVPAFNAQVLFDKLDDSIKQMLMTIFPSKMKAGVSYTEAEQEALKVYRNFAWPTRDFIPLLKAMGKTELSEKVALARTKYINTLSQLSRDHSLNPQKINQQSLEIQGALTEFAAESEIFEAMRDFFKANTL